MCYDDFFFGKVNVKKPVLNLREVISLSNQVSGEFFTNQINRLLFKTGGRLTLSDSTSFPPLKDFLDNILTEQTGFVELYARTDVNPTVKATLACDIFFPEGVITIMAHWCAYKTMRADEIISTLLIPLHLKGLHERTYIVFEDGSKERLLCDGDIKNEIVKIFMLSHYPLDITSGKCQDSKRVDEYFLSLNNSMMVKENG